MPEKTVLCFGDSNTYGANPAPQGPPRYGTAVRWPCALAEKLGAGWRVVEEGLPGRTAVFDDPVSEGLAGLPYLRPCMLSHGPLDCIVFMLGTNDTKERFSAGPGVIAECMARLVEKALQTEAWRAEPGILLVAPAHIHPIYMEREIGLSLGPGCAEKSRALAPLYRGIAGRFGIDFLDAAAVAQADMADGVHLTADSHVSLARAVSGVLKNKG